MDQPLCIPKITLVQALEAALPPVFAGKRLDALTGQAFRWKSIQNLRSLKLIPQSIFFRAGRAVAILRAPFIEWACAQAEAQATPTTAHLDPNAPPRRPRGRPRKHQMPTASVTSTQAPSEA